MSPSKTAATKPAKVLIVDDHPAVREALALRISRQSDLRVCGEAADVDEALRLFKAMKPDVAVVDIVLKDGNGIDLIKRAKARDDHVLILVWSMYDPLVYAERALNAGARGYIQKEQATKQIIYAIRQMLNGKVYLPAPIADLLLDRSGGPSTGLPPSDCLSDRELEAFQFIGQGLDTGMIADKMHVGRKTVDTFRARIKSKLNLASNNELIRCAVEWVLQNR
jgi:DNA-binding NarL/FixJ family response regulator